jgi:hypothetical protein
MIPRNRELQEIEMVWNEGGRNARAATQYVADTVVRHKQHASMQASKQISPSNHDFIPMRATIRKTLKIARPYARSFAAVA